MFATISILSFGLYILFSSIINRYKIVLFDNFVTVFLQTRTPENTSFAFKIFSVLGSFEVTCAATLLIAGYLFFLKKKRWLAISFLFIFLTLPVEMIGKWFWYHPGPPETFYRKSFHLILPSGFVRTDFSYPSGHSARTMFLCFLTFFAMPRTKWRAWGRAAIFLFLSVMLFSRIVLGEHWATDVIGGALLGIAVASAGLSLTHFRSSKKVV